ncbi:hypothetical protein HNY73_003633 [Argiope bruennichi]|uniref:Uncharacterized protein n=1 Tax=Argiope bruennichi TaxID=94029 RepID=A0A8T0FP82_ARGBR|nr:hypothetical protein HNY73_003633 [Argiope bruennichi]
MHFEIFGDTITPKRCGCGGCGVIMGVVCVIMALIIFPRSLIIALIALEITTNQFYNNSHATGNTTTSFTTTTLMALEITTNQFYNNSHATGNTTTSFTTTTLMALEITTNQFYNNTHGTGNNYQPVLQQQSRHWK